MSGKGKGKGKKGKGKKGKGKKGKKGSDDGGASGGGGAANERGAEEVRLFQEAYERQQVVVRVSELEAENARLREEVEEERRRLEQRISDQQDVIHVVNRQLEEQKVAEEEHRRLAEELRVQLQQERDRFEAQLREERAQRGNGEAVAAKERRRLEAELRELEVFKAEKEGMEAELAELREELAEAKRRHRLEFDDLERRSLAEKNELKNDMLEKVRETKMTLLNMTDDQLHTTTKRTIMENEQMTSELHYQSKVTERLLEQNTKLVEQNKAMRQEIDLHEDAERMLATRIHFFQKMITKLKQKVRTLDEAGSRAETRFEYSIHQLEEHGVRQNSIIERQHEQLRQLEEAYRELEEDNEELQRRLKHAHVESQQVAHLRDDAATFLLTCLEDVKRAMILEGTPSSPSSKAQRLPQRLHLKSLTLGQREHVLQSLLQRLDASHAPPRSPPQRGDGGLFPPING